MQIFRHASAMLPMCYRFTALEHSKLAFKFTDQNKQYLNTYLRLVTDHTEKDGDCFIYQGLVVPIAFCVNGGYVKFVNHFYVLHMKEFISFTYNYYIYLLLHEIALLMLMIFS